MENATLGQKYNVTTTTDFFLNSIFKRCLPYVLIRTTFIHPIITLTVGKLQRFHTSPWQPRPQSDAN